MMRMKVLSRLRGDKLDMNCRGEHETSSGLNFEPFCSCVGTAILPFREIISLDSSAN